MTKKHKRDLQEATGDWTFEELEGRTLRIYLGKSDGFNILVGRDEMAEESFVLAIEDVSQSGGLH